VGATDNILLSSTIGRKKNLITADVISAIINGTEELIKELDSFGVTIQLAGKLLMLGTLFVPLL
jgi:phosphoribosylformylglycinamidine cyclo-ligase